MIHGMKQRKKKEICKMMRGWDKRSEEGNKKGSKRGKRI
jgi:hypothetical protein